MNSEKPWKSRMERDIIMHEDLKESGLQGGKIIADKLGLFSFIIGIPFLLVSIYAVISMVFDLGFPINPATIILILVVMSIGVLCTVSGYLLCKY